MGYAGFLGVWVSAGSSWLALDGASDGARGLGFRRSCAGRTAMLNKHVARCPVTVRLGPTPVLLCILFARPLESAGCGHAAPCKLLHNEGDST